MGGTRGRREGVLMGCWSGGREKGKKREKEGGKMRKDERERNRGVQGRSVLEKSQPVKAPLWSWFGPASEERGVCSGQGGDCGSGRASRQERELLSWVGVPAEQQRDQAGGCAEGRTCT